MKNALFNKCAFTARVRLPLLLLLLVLPFFAVAKHIIGGEMTYRFVSSDGVKNTYEFTLVVFRDCDSGGGNLDPVAHVGIYRSNSSALYQKKDVSIQPIQNVPPVIPPCADASAVTNACVQRGTYIFTLNLPIDSVNSYYIVYQRCCRTEQIVNINDPDAYGATYMVELTPLAQIMQNSSPVFTNYPATFICSFFDLHFDHSATDADGDSLVYSFCSPLTGGGQGGGNGCNSPTPNPSCGPPFSTVNFIGLYSEMVPMGGNPVITVDPVTGQLSGTPNILGQYVVGICVNEYRNGQLIGSILRDFQFNVVDCNPTVVANIQSDTITGPQEFTVKRCGQKIVTILNASPQTPDLETWQWEFNLGNGNTHISNAWNTTFLLPDYGVYSGRLYLNRNLSCEDTAFITIRAFPGSEADFDFEWDVCSETPVYFSDSSASGASGGILERFWVFSTLGDTLYGTNPEILFPAYGNYPVKLVVIDSDVCVDTLQQSVDWNPQIPPPIPDFAAQKVCLPDPALFDGLEALNLVNYTYEWNFGDSTFSSEMNPQHVFDSAGEYNISVLIRNGFDCFSTDTFPALVKAFYKPVAGFDYAPEAISNLDNRVHFFNTSSSDAAQWQWRFGAEGQSISPGPVHEFRDTGLIEVNLTVTNNHGCVDSTVQTLDIVPKTRLYLPNIFAPESDSGLGNDRFGILGILPGYHDYHISIWSRWGELVFESKDASEGWNGRKGNTGKLAPRGVYVYQITMVGPRGEPFRWEGTVTVI